MPYACFQSHRKTQALLIAVKLEDAADRKWSVPTGMWLGRGQLARNGSAVCLAGHLEIYKQLLPGRQNPGRLRSAAVRTPPGAAAAAAGRGRRRRGCSGAGGGRRQQTHGHARRQRLEREAGRMQRQAARAHRRHGGRSARRRQAPSVCIPLDGRDACSGASVISIDFVLDYMKCSCIAADRWVGSREVLDQGLVRDVVMPCWSRLPPSRRESHAEIMKCRMLFSLHPRPPLPPGGFDETLQTRYVKKPAYLPDFYLDCKTYHLLRVHCVKYTI